MTIKEIKALDKELKGFLCIGKVKYVGETKRMQGTGKNGKDYDFTTTSLLIEDDTDNIYCQFTDVKFGDVEGKEISCISCKINEYIGKDGVLKRTLRANDYSFDVIPADPAHPELPPTRKIEDKEPAEIQRDKARETYASPVKKEDVQSSVWSEKDLRIVRQHETSDAVALVCKYFKGSLEEATAQVILTSNMLVDNVYQDLSYPIKNKTQAELLNDMQENSDKNVADAAESVASLRKPTQEGDLIDGIDSPNDVENRT